MERRKLIRNLFPEYLKENKEFDIFIDTVVHEMGLDGDNIELFSGVSDINRMPECFLEDLSDLFGYEYKQDIPADIQREVLKRILSVAKERGSESSIAQSANFGYSTKWVGKDLTIYDGAIEPNLSEIIYPYEMLFTLSTNNAKLSGGTVLADNDLYSDGVMIIKVSVINERLKDKVKAQIPAGLKYIFQISKYCEGSFAEEFNNPKSFYETHATIVVPLEYIATTLTLSKNLGTLSGDRIARTYEVLSFFLKSDFNYYGNELIKNEFKINTDFDGIKCLSQKKGIIGRYKIGGKNDGNKMYANWLTISPDNNFTIVDNVLKDDLNTRDLVADVGAGSVCSVDTGITLEYNGKKLMHVLTNEEIKNKAFKEPNFENYFSLESAFNIFQFWSKTKDGNEWSNCFYGLASIPIKNHSLYAFVTTVKVSFNNVEEDFNRYTADGLYEYDIKDRDYAKDGLILYGYTVNKRGESTYAYLSNKEKTIPVKYVKNSEGTVHYSTSDVILLIETKTGKLPVIRSRDKSEKYLTSYTVTDQNTAVFTVNSYDTYFNDLPDNVDVNGYTCYDNTNNLQYYIPENGTIQVLANKTQPNTIIPNFYGWYKAKRIGIGQGLQATVPQISHDYIGIKQYVNGYTFNGTNYPSQGELSPNDTIIVTQPPNETSFIRFSFYHDYENENTAYLTIDYPTSASTLTLGWDMCVMVEINYYNNTGNKVRLQQTYTNPVTLNDYDDDYLWTITDKTTNVSKSLMSKEQVSFRTDNELKLYIKREYGDEYVVDNEPSIDENGRYKYVVHFNQSLTPSVCTVTFYSNIGADPYVLKIQNSEIITMPKYMFTLPEDRRFDGWSCNNKQYATGAILTITDNTEIYPMLTKLYKYTYTDLDGIIISTQWIAEGEYPVEPDYTKQAGYIYSWKIDPYNSRNRIQIKIPANVIVTYIIMVEGEEFDKWTVSLETDTILYADYNLIRKHIETSSYTLCSEVKDEIVNGDGSSKIVVSYKKKMIEVVYIKMGLCGAEASLNEEYKKESFWIAENYTPSQSIEIAGYTAVQKYGYFHIKADGNYYYSEEFDSFDIAMAYKERSSSIYVHDKYTPIRLWVPSNIMRGGVVIDRKDDYITYSDPSNLNISLNEWYNRVKGWAKSETHNFTCYNGDTVITTISGATLLTNEFILKFYKMGVTWIVEGKSYIF